MSERSLTPRWQRIAIWIIAIVMLGGTLAGLVFMVLSTMDSKINPSNIAREEQAKNMAKARQEYQKEQAEERKKKRGLDGYADKVASFDAKTVTALAVDTLKEGDGATVSSDSTLSANYTGWTPDGKIFDSTKSEGSAAKPVTFSLKGVIKGWSEGLSGKKVGGVYLLSIPANMAYGERGSADGSIAPNTPLKFVVEIVKLEKSS